MEAVTQSVKQLSITLFLRDLIPAAVELELKTAC